MSEPTARRSLTRSAVVDAATELFTDADDVSIRDLAAHLEVSPMALYRHVESKEDLLGDVVDRLLVGRWRPQVDPANWREWIIDAADRMRQFLVDRPAALSVYLRRPVLAATALERMTTCLDVLQTALGDEQRAHRAYAAVHSYTLGFAALESAREADPSTSTSNDADAVLNELISYASPAQFHAGLGYLLDGVVSAR